MEEKKKVPEYTLRAIRKYRKKAMRSISISLHKKNKADVLEKLDSVPNKTEYIVNLIRDDIKRNG